MNEQQTKQRTCGYQGDQPCQRPATNEIQIGDLTVYLCEPHLARIIALIAQHLKEQEL